MKEVNWWMVLTELFYHCLFSSFQTVWKTSMHYSCRVHFALCITPCFTVNTVHYTVLYSLHCITLCFTLCITLCFTVYTVYYTMLCSLHCITLCFTFVKHALHSNTAFITVMHTLRKTFTLRDNFLVCDVISKWFCKSRSNSHSVITTGTDHIAVLADSKYCKSHINIGLYYLHLSSFRKFGKFELNCRNTCNSTESTLSKLYVQMDS